MSANAVYDAVMPAAIDQLSPAQRRLLDEWLPGMEVVTDHSWGLVGTTVLEVLHDGQRLIVKAADEADRHLARELRGHRLWLEPLASQGLGPRLLHADDDAKLIVTVFLPGRLVQGTAAEWDPEVYRRAGEVLALFHDQPIDERTGSTTGVEYEAHENARALSWLDTPHRIEPSIAARLRDEIATWPTPPVRLAPSHGDWQPRNWLVDEGGHVRVIDFGRADLRPAMVDFARLNAQQFRTMPALEQAFLDGYGTDPRDPEGWVRVQVREGMATAVWAYHVGDEGFERQGHRMIDEALAQLSG